jgi:hypothetical protein
MPKLSEEFVITCSLAVTVGRFGAWKWPTRGQNIGSNKKSNMKHRTVPLGAVLQE